MEPNFWRTRWKNGQIGFHRSEVHPLLERFVDRLPRGGRVLVPLAGKSIDLHYLADRGHSVVGVELVEDAVRQFFEEAKIEPEIVRSTHSIAYQAGPIEMHAADFFQMTPQHLGRCDAVYDRAALIALPVAMRARYAAHLASLLPRQSGILMITVEYDAGQMSGPPFSVPPLEVEAIFGGPFEIFQLSSAEATLDEQSSLKKRGLASLQEHALWLRRRG